jgi:hypothetical protein
MMSAWRADGDRPAFVAFGRAVAVGLLGEWHWTGRVSQGL